MIIQRHSYRNNVHSCSVVRNPQGALCIIPKASAAVVYSPPTAYTAYWLDETKFQDVNRDLSGSQLMKDQDGYDCLLICNAMNGFYMQTGVWKRDPYTRNIEGGYIRPPYRTPPLPWARTPRAGYLTPIEVCCTASTVPQRYEVNSRADANLHTEAPMKECRTSQLVVTPKSTYVSKYPTLDATNYTATYVTSIGVRYVHRGGANEPTTLARDCPAPYNEFPSTIHFSEESMSTIRGYWHVCKEEYVTIQNSTTEPYKTTSGSLPVVFDTELKRSTEDKNYLNRVLPILWDWPTVRIETKSGIMGVGRESNLQPVVVMPMMIYHDTRVEGEVYCHGVLDGWTGKRTARGKTAITYVTNDSIRSHYATGTYLLLTMKQLSRPITKHPIFDYASLREILQEVKS